MASGKDDVVDHATMRFEKNARGAELCCYFWPASQTPVKGIVQVIHGHGSYIPHDFLRIEAPGQAPVYKGSWVEAINQAGYSVCGVDVQGAGRSAGRRYWFDKFDDYVDDGLMLSRRCSKMDVPGFEQGLPLFLLGGSLGGCISVMMGLREGSLFSGVVLLAPMISLDKLSKKPINRILRPLVGLLNRVAPRLAAAQVAKNEKYPLFQEIFDKDPLCYHKATRVRSAYEYLRITGWLMDGGVAKVDFPFIIFHSEADTMCDCDGSKALHSKAVSSDKTMHLVNDMWHFITKEPGNDKVRADILEWMNERAARRAN